MMDSKSGGSVLIPKSWLCPACGERRMFCWLETIGQMLDEIRTHRLRGDPEGVRLAYAAEATVAKLRDHRMALMDKSDSP